MSNIIDFKKGQQFTLTESDWKPEFMKRPKWTARVGLAIDNHIKKIVAQDDTFVIPEDKFERYDFKDAQMSYDIKSFAGKTVTVSAREYAYAQEEKRLDRDVCYLVFEQINKSDFKYHGSVLFSELEKARKLSNSHYDHSYYFFASSVK